VVEACPLLQLAPEFAFTRSAATRPPNRLRFATDRLRLTAAATARGGAAQHVSRDQTQDVDTHERRLQIPAACRKRAGIGHGQRKPHRADPQSHGLTAERVSGLRKTGDRVEKVTSTISRSQIVEFFLTFICAFSSPPVEAQ